MILHIDMDAFFASVEQHLNPQLQGKPVIVGVRNNKYHTVVSAASYEAKAYGVNSGMPSKEAFKICPQAEFVSSDFSKYAVISQEIFEFLQQFSPYVEHSTIDEFDLEISGLEAFFGPPLDMGKLIKKSIRETFGLPCSIGIGPTWVLAKLGSKIRKPDGLILINKANLDAIIQGLPVERICGIGPALTAHLHSFGIITCDQLKATSEQILVNNFGQSAGQWLHGIFRTNDENLSSKDAHFETTETPKSIGHSHTLPKETKNEETILAYIRMLSEMVAQRARKNKIMGHTISISFSSKNDSFSRQKTYRIPTNDGWEIFMRSKAILAQKRATSGAPCGGDVPTHKDKGIRPVRVIGVSLSGLNFDSAPPLFIEQKRRGALLNVMDKINAKFGDQTLTPAILTKINLK